MLVLKSSSGKWGVENGVWKVGPGLFFDEANKPDTFSDTFSPLS
jgi:hypothetical protein